jgi:membrane fusion protein (multidrug efflux system)
MRKTSKNVIKFLCVVTLLFYGCGSKDDKSSGDTVKPARVRVIKVVKGDIETEIKVTGTILPKRETFIGPKVSGRIDKFFVDEGDFVKQGSPLVQLEKVRFDLMYKEAEASYNESLSSLKNIEKKLIRQKDLFKKGITDKERFDDIVTEADLAKAREEMAKSRFNNTKEDIKDSVLKAPFSGFVVERKMNAGEMYSGRSGEYVFHMVDTHSVKVELNMIETKKRFIKTGKTVSVLVDAIPDKVFEGKIEVVNPFVDIASRKFLVKIKLDNPDFMLESGMFARVSIPEEQHSGVLLVPAAALIEREGKKLIFLAMGGKAVARPVKTGLRTHEFSEVIDGDIKPGDPVIVDGFYAVKDGSPIIIQD